MVAVGQGRAARPAQAPWGVTGDAAGWSWPSGWAPAEARLRALRGLCAGAGYARALGRVLGGLCAAPVRAVRPFSDVTVEAACGALLLAGVTWGGVGAWRFYDAQLRPLARTPAATLRVYGVRADDPAAVRRYQAAMDALGEAVTEWQAKRPDWARAALERALALDPENPDARALLQRIELEPAPTVTPDEQAARQRDAQVTDLVGAANAFFDAGQTEEACALLAQAQAAAPAHPLVVGAAPRAAGCEPAAAPQATAASERGP